jgi:hypothetical protein
MENLSLPFFSFYFSVRLFSNWLYTNCNRITQMTEQSSINKTKFPFISDCKITLDTSPLPSLYYTPAPRMWYRPTHICCNAVDANYFEIWDFMFQLQWTERLYSSLLWCYILYFIKQMLTFQSNLWLLQASFLDTLLSTKLYDVTCQNALILRLWYVLT